MRLAGIDEVPGLPGYSIHSWPRWAPQWLKSLSITLAIIRRIYLADHIVAAPESRLMPVLTHELTHARRAEDAGRFWWTLRYLTSRRYRLKEEVYGEAAEALNRINAALSPVDPSDYARYISASRLHGWQWPYFTGANREGVVRLILMVINATIKESLEDEA